MLPEHILYHAPSSSYNIRVVREEDRLAQAH
jgi:hypothetical protein